MSLQLSGTSARPILIDKFMCGDDTEDNINNILGVNNTAIQFHHYININHILNLCKNSDMLRGMVAHPLHYMLCRLYINLLRGMMTHPLHEISRMSIVQMLRGMMKHPLHEMSRKNFVCMSRGMKTHPPCIMSRVMTTQFQNTKYSGPTIITNDRNSIDQRNTSDSILFDECNSLVKLSFVNTEKKVVGKRYFFASNSLHRNWMLQCICSKRVVPSHVHNYVAVECNSYQTTNRQMKGMLLMIGTQQNLPFKKQFCGKRKITWRLFVVNKLTANTINGFFVDSHGSLFHGEMKHVSCSKNIIFTAINLWSRQLVPLVSNLATFNARDGGIDAQVAPSVVRIDIATLVSTNRCCRNNTSHNCKTKICDDKKKRKRCIGFVKRLTKKRKLLMNWLTIYVNTNLLNLPYDIGTNDKGLVVPHIKEKKIISKYYNTVTFSVVTFITMKEKLLPMLDSTSPSRFKYNAKYFSDSTFDLIHIDSAYPNRIVLCTQDEYDLLKNTSNCTETEWKDNSFLHELTSLPNHELKGVTVSMWTKHNFESKITLDDVKNLNNALGSGYGQRYCTKNIGLQAFFGPRYSHRPLMNPNYGEGPTKFSMDYYRQTFSNPEILLQTRPKIIHAAKEALNVTRFINSNYMEFVGYNTCKKVIWTSGYVERKKTTINSRNEIKETKKKKNYCPFGFANTPHKDMKDKVHEKTVSLDMQNLNKLKQGSVTDYINRIQARYGIGIPTTCGYQYCGDTTDMHIEAMFAVLIFAQDIVHNSVHHFLAWTFPHFTPVVRVDSDLIYVFNNNTDIDFILAAWGTSGGNEESRMTASDRQQNYT